MRFDEFNNAMGPKTTGGAAELAQSRRLLAKLEQDFEKEFGRPLPVNPGRTRERTRADQQNLYARAQRGEGGVYMPANPAKNPTAEYFHLFAFDSSGIRPEEERWLRTQGWIRPFRLRDPVHYQYVGDVNKPFTTTRRPAPNSQPQLNKPTSTNRTTIGSTNDLSQLANKILRGFIGPK